MGYYVGIDIGTSSAKLLLIDAVGSIKKSCSRSYDITECRPGWKEIDPEQWMHAVEDAFAELLSGIDTKQVKSIGVTGQMHTIIFLDESGKSIRPALMWNDTRTAHMLADIKEKILALPDMSYAANVISTGSPAVGLLWLKENEPEHFSQMKKFLIGPDYIVYRLTGQYQTDYCEASTSSLFDLRTVGWSKELRELFGFPEYIYPQVKGAAETAGTLLPQYQEKYGLNQDVKVITGTGDNPAAAISTGCLVKKYPVLSFGTSGVLMYPREQVNYDAKGKNILFSMDGRKVSVLVQGVVQSCGSSLAWWIEKIQQTKDYDGEILGVDLSRLGENPVLFYPHLAGDKTIYADPGLRGCFLEIGTEITRQDMAIAVMEGICFAVKQLADEMGFSADSLTDLRVTGGGAKNEVWMQILADILDIPVIQMENHAGAGYGIALTAAAAITKGLSIEQIAGQMISEKKRFRPRAYNAQLYQKKYKKYLRINKALQILQKED